MFLLAVASLSSLFSVSGGLLSYTPLQPRMAHSARKDSPELPDFSMLKRLAKDQLIYLLEQVKSQYASAEFGSAGRQTIMLCSACLAGATNTNISEMILHYLKKLTSYQNSKINLHTVIGRHSPVWLWETICLGQVLQTSWRTWEILREGHRHWLSEDVPTHIYTESCPVCFTTKYNVRVCV